MVFVEGVIRLDFVVEVIELAGPSLRFFRLWSDLVAVEAFLWQSTLLGLGSVLGVYVANAVDQFLGFAVLSSPVLVGFLLFWPCVECVYLLGDFRYC